VGQSGAKTEQMTDGEIIERVLRGETRLFGDLVRRYQDEVYGMAVRFVGSAADAEDVAQEVFLRVHRGLDGFKGEAQFSTWLFRVTYNLCADWLRKHKKPHRAVAGLDEVADVADGRVDLERGLLVAEERDQVRRAVDELDETYRGVVVLLYYQKMSYEQIAGVLAVPVKTVETRLYRARKLLRKSLETVSGQGGLS
jgi:RNA polymerase sigma-70 factor, ECF subfamily